MKNLTLNGIVVDEDGKPVAGAIVWLKERQYDDALEVVITSNQEPIKIVFKKEK